MPRTSLIVVALLAWAPCLQQGSCSTSIASALRTSDQECRQGEGIVQINDANSIHARKKSQTRMKRGHAEARITVQHSESKPVDQSDGPALMEIHLDETFAGDIEGESPVRALQVVHANHSATLVSMQRFRGKLAGREGTFVLQGSETVEKGRISAKWFVVPGSGTGELAGLRGEGGFAGEFGKGSNGTLDYWFE